MKNILILTVSLIMFLFSTLKAGISTDENAKIDFKIRNMGVNVDGKFEKYKIDIQYDKLHPEKSVFNGVIKVASINTGIEMRDKHLRNEDYFEVEKYPNITFNSTSVVQKEIGVLLVSGILTIKDVKKKIILEVKVKTTGDNTHFTTELKLNRLDYNVGSKSMMTSNDVYITINVIQ